MTATNYTVRDGHVLFWNSHLSNWWPCEFSVGGVRYNCAEQYMMAEKARMFGDDEALGRIMASPSPREQKAIGRQVRGFDAAAWGVVARDRVFTGVLAKYEQNPDLAALLLSTGDLPIVEASPYDTVWGIGLGEDHADATNASKWRGTNWLGEVLMRVRKHLREAKASRV